jgi:hypothetical protein
VSTDIIGLNMFLSDQMFVSKRSVINPTKSAIFTRRLT